jgi:PIN domain nuclease of toxin-antitoxin system
MLKTTHIIFVLLGANALFAQSNTNLNTTVEIKTETLDLSTLKNVELGYAYAQCRIADEYETLTDYNWRTRLPDTIFEKNHRIGIKIITPTLKPEKIARFHIKLYDAYPIYFLKGSKINSRKKIHKLTKKGSITLLPPVYRVRGKRMEVHRDTAENFAWRRVRGDANCLSQNPNDCIQLVAVTGNVLQIPVFTKFLKTPALLVNAQHDTIALPFNSPFLDSIVVPARFVDFEYHHLNINDIVYQRCDTITTTKIILRDSIRKVVVRKGGMSEWKRVLCSHKVGSVRIAEVQTALFFAGYYFGKIDNVLGRKTKMALIQFQKDNDLPIGALDNQTLNSLGCDYFRNPYSAKIFIKSDIINPFYPNYSELISRNAQEFKNMGFNLKELRKRGFLP